MITITVRPAGHGTFDAYLGDELLCKRSATPFLQSARILMARGIPAHTEYRMQHAMRDGVALSSRLGTAAKLSLKEGRGPPGFQPWVDMRKIQWGD